MVNISNNIVRTNAVTEIDGIGVRTSEGVMTVEITKRNGGAGPVESVADILERELRAVIKNWLVRVEQAPELTCIPMNFQDRTCHLPQLLHDVIVRLRLDAGTKSPTSKAAAEHGDLRRR